MYLFANSSICVSLGSLLFGWVFSFWLVFSCLFACLIDCQTLCYLPCWELDIFLFWVLHCVNMPHFIHFTLGGHWIVFNFWQSLRTLLEYSSTCALVNEHVYGFSFSMYTWECNWWVIGYSYVQPQYILPNSFIKQLCQFVFLPGVYANSACSQLTSTWYFSMFIRATFYFNLCLSNLGNWAYFHKYFFIYICLLLDYLSRFS